MVRWLNAMQFKVVLVLAAESLDRGTLSELQKISHAVYWLKPALRTRIGTRLPALRRVTWEPLKKLVRLWRTGRVPSGKANALAPADEGLKSVFAPLKLVALVQRLARRHHPSAVIAEYIFSSPVFSRLPTDTLRIIDTIDVFYRKEVEVLSFGIADPLACSRDEEREYLLASDAIIAIQSRELALLQDLVPDRDVFLTGIDFDVVASVDDAKVIPHSVTVVASDNELNVHGLTEFLSESWPAIRSAVPSATLHVVGNVGAKCPTSDRSVRYSGWVDDLDPVYREASVIINPTIAGTGLKIKSAQALAHGKPLVAWTNGVEGLDYNGPAPYVVCQSWRAFSDAVTCLLQSAEDRQRLSERALAYAKQKFDADGVYAALKYRLENHQTSIRCLESLQSATPRHVASSP
jgi:glycosyltransferase involved in cell wall biosynthesis